jgi:hypothetical protein
MYLTKEELKQIYYLNKEIKMWQKELERLQCKSLIKGQEITGMPFVTGTSDKVGDMATTMADIEAIIRGKLAEIQLQRKKIISYIDGIDDSLLRQVIYLRNVSCMNWSQVANELGCTECNVKQLYSRYFKHGEAKK